MNSYLRPRDPFRLFTRYLQPDQIAEARNDAGHFAIYATMLIIFGLILNAVPNSLPQQHFGMAAVVLVVPGLGFGALSIWYAHLIRVTQAVMGGASHQT